MMNKKKPLTSLSQTIFSKMPDHVFQVRLPTRIDLAGGTLDLWPLYLLFPPAHTVYLAISLWARVKLQVWKNTSDALGKIQLGSDTHLFSIEDRKEALMVLQDPKWALVRQVLRYVLPLCPQKSSFSLAYSTQSPHGAGLGGSSALLCAFLKAFSYWLFPKKTFSELVYLARDLESEMLWTPCGLQDYVAALYQGGGQIKWKRGQKFELCFFSKTLLQALSERLMLFFLGESHFSVVPNAHVYEQVLFKKTPKVIQALSEISEISALLTESLKKQDWPLCATFIEREQHARKTLSLEIETPLFQEVKKQLQTLPFQTAMKVCGAGGGGCFFVWVPSGNAIEKKQVREKLKSFRVRAIAFDSAEKTRSK